MDPDFVRTFFDIFFSIQMRVVEQYYGAIGEYIDLTMSGDDFGMQSGPLVSPAMFHNMVVPYFSRRIARTKELANCLYWHHTDGSVLALIEDLIACGVDILNPVQTSAQGMAPETIKRAAGDRLTFWGAIDTQDLLRTATPDEVRATVREMVTILGKGGGYVVAPAHNIQNDVPIENVIAMIEAAKEAK